MALIPFVTPLISPPANPPKKAPLIPAPKPSAKLPPLAQMLPAALTKFPLKTI